MRQERSNHAATAICAPLIVYIDFKSPYAYLAVEPTRKMLAQHDLVADWRPFVLDIQSYLGSAKLGKNGKVAEQSRSAEQWSGVKYAYFDCRRYANLRSLTVRGTVKIWNTDLPAIGMFWLKQQASPKEQCRPDSLLNRYIDAIYEPFWKREMDVEQLDVIEDVLSGIGADVTGFRAYVEGAGLDFNADFQHSAFEAGVYGVPTYVLQDATGATTQRYFGREHLPRITWHLTGEQGPAPDIAYESGFDAGRTPPATKSLTVCVDFKSAGAYLAAAHHRYGTGCGYRSAVANHPHTGLTRADRPWRKARPRSIAQIYPGSLCCGRLATLRCA